LSALPPIPPPLLPDPPKLLPPLPELLEPPDPPVLLLPKPPPVPLGLMVSFSMLRSLSGMESSFYGQLNKRMSHADEDYFRLLRELLARSPLSPWPERTE
jgi:hypothetical protein